MNVAASSSGATRGLGAPESRDCGGTASQSCGAGGSSGVCNERIAPDAALVQSCVLGNACDPLVPDLSLSQCITYDTPSDCARAAGNCTDVASCNLRRWEDASACDATDPGWKCDGSRAIQCGDERPWSVDCAALGGYCELYEDSSTHATWPCRLPQGYPCPSDSEHYLCSHDIRYTCRGGRPFGVDCSKLGLSCIYNITGHAYCGAIPKSCDSPNSSQCIDNAVHVCGASGFAFTYDCTRGGGNCETDGGQNWYCPAPGCSPKDELTCAESCIDSTVMKVCVGGAPYFIDCATYGFQRCVLYENTTENNHTYVGCL